MQAIILAAGMGKRLKELTADNTKCMVRVNGVSLIERALRQLEDLHLSRIIIVVGYRGEKLMEFIDSIPGITTPVIYVDNPIYDRTNNIYSLALASDYLTEDDTLLLESDLIFEEGVLRGLAEDPRDTLVLVDKYESWMDGTVVTIGPEDEIRSFVPGKNFVFEHIPQYYKTVNIYKFSKEFSVSKYVPFLHAYTMALGNNEYYEQVLRVIAMLDDPGIRARRLSGEKWYEIDDIQDLDIAESIFAENDDEFLSRIQRRYGGYWRYPGMVDFCYLVNPFYPPQKLKDEMKANFETLLTQYPSGMQVNSLLAAKNFGLRANHVVVGNGAAELIKALMEGVDGKAGFIRPTFEEYPNRFPKERSVVFVPETEDFSYTVEDLKKAFGGGAVRTLILINPDNPTGHYLPRASVLELAEWCAGEHIRLIYDESFIDFAKEENPSLLTEDILAAYPDMVIVKSISKSFGVPGVRLGILASGDNALIDRLKKDVAIWNINSFGEFYLQIAEKYKKSYQSSLQQLADARDEFSEMLRSLGSLTVYPSQANYIMLELKGGNSSREITKKLLSAYNIFVKDLTPKMHSGDRQFLRVAVRTMEENRRLVQALREILEP